MLEEKEIYGEEKTPSRWTLKNYFGGIKRYKWWVIGSTALAAVIGFCTIKFVVTPFKETLSATYTYNLAATVDEQGTYRFIDGSLFDCYDIVSKENLVAVRESDKKTFESVDVAKLYSKNELSITRRIDSSTAPENIEISYKISAKTSAFPNKETGKAFIYELIKSPLALSTKAIANFSINSYINEDFDQKTFEQQLNDLHNQYVAINSTYYTLETTFGSSTLVDGKGLNEYSHLFRSKNSDGVTNSVDSLIGRLYSEHYIRYEKGKETQKIDEIDKKCESYVMLLADKTKELKRNEESLDALTKATTISTTDTEYLKKIANYTEKVDDLKSTINKIEKQLAFYGWEDKGSGYEATDSGVRKELKDKTATWVEGNDKFVSAVDSLKESLIADRESATNVYRSVYSTYCNKVTLINAGYVVSTGSVSSLIGVGAGLVGGFLLSSLICMAVHVYKDDKKKQK